MTIGFEFQAVYACGVHALCGVGVVLDDAGNVPFLDGFRESAVRLLANS